jgi:nitrate/TMAO reductase-like tetraheme cytochrome c subunit
MRPDKWLLERWHRLTFRQRVAGATIGAVLLLGTSVVGYRQYTFMMHDNKFCLSCHLMSGPYNLFMRSAHNQLSCHSCHPANLSAAWQLYAALVLKQTEVKKHAVVPNETCGACHVRGDPERWRIIAGTAGHRMHLESHSPALRSIMCTDCHGASLHEFRPNQQTCLQAGCHAYAHIRLGRMASLDFYCTTCHAFTAEAPTLTYDSLGQPLSPKAQQCFSCHEMQQQLSRMDFMHDPHRGECGDCHNPHEQRQAVEAARTCTTGSCHTTWRASPFHNGVPNPTECTRCHIPHSWKVEGSNCLRCHRNIPEPTRPGRTHRAALPPGGGPAEAAAN